MKDVLGPSTWQEGPEHPMPRSPRPGRPLVGLSLVLLSLVQLFTFVPALLSPVLDLLALALLGALSVWGMVALFRRVRR